ncbi:MAG: translation initiation factor IF-2 [Thermodesulfobacteriota bacterium]|nr:translation initiation factor IF-2 [Thermodesulfobacteriota bacterium]
MTKVRVHELAKELKMENKDLLKLLEKMGLSVKTVHSTLEDSDVERVKNQISLSRKEGVVEQRIKPTVIRRRVKREDVTPSLPEPAAQEEVKPPTIKKGPAPEVVKVAVKPEEKKAKAEGKVEIPLPPPAGIKIPPAPMVTPPAEPAPPVSAVADAAHMPAKAREIPVVEVHPVPGPEAPLKEIEATSPLPQVEKPAVALGLEPIPVIKPKIPEKPYVKPLPKVKKKHEPAKIIERPAAPPPSLVPEYPEAGKISPVIVTPKAPGVRPKPPIILQRPTPAIVRPASEEEERGRRKKKVKKDVQVLEEGKPHRVRIISTKKRPFREHDILREDRGPRAFSLERESRAKGPKAKMTKPEITVSKAIKRKIRISEVILVGELAKRMGIKASEVIKKLMELGLMVTINQAIDADAAALVATDFGYEVEKTGFEIEDLMEEKEERTEDLIPRPPVVTIMGHVDHGKTSLLDAIRQTNVTAGEAGGITQHIGAYEVDVDHRKVVFLDTPGHEAFTAMRARGAKVTDIVVLVVAADDGVMNQTIEAINHAKAAQVPLIVAINKIDKPNANPERVKQALTEYGLVAEAWGGQTIFAEISAKQKIGLKELLEMILLQAEILELKGNPNRPSTGVVIEAKLDRGRGPVATVLVQDGTLHTGDAFVSGIHFGHVRAMINDHGEKMESAGPSTPVEVIGFPSVPNAGDSFVVITDERRAKELATQRLLKQREIELSKTSKVTLEDFYKKMKKGVVKDLNLIFKADVQGSIEALVEALNRLSTEAVKVNILHTSVGAINESDCMLASASEAIILGFNVKIEPKAQILAEQEKIDIRLYSVIYDALDDVRKAMEGLLEPVYEERLMGRAEVRQLFNISRIGTIAGSFVLEGKIIRGSHAHLVRNGQVIHEGNITSLKRLKDDFKEVASGFECGITVGEFRDYSVNDIIESYVVEKLTAQL